MAFAYLIGVALYGILYLIGMKILKFFDPEPEIPPCEQEFDMPSVMCVLTINGKVFNAIKKEHIRKDYYYNADCDILEYTEVHKKYTLDKMICENDMIDKVCMICEVIDGEESIKCYATVDRKSLISYESETEEKVYSYRKPFKRMKMSA